MSILLFKNGSKMGVGCTLTPTQLGICWSVLAEQEPGNKVFFVVIALLPKNTRDFTQENGRNKQ